MAEELVTRFPKTVREKLAQRLEQLEREKITTLERDFSRTLDADVEALLVATRNERDRILAALQGSEADQIPWNTRYIEVGDSVTIREVGSRTSERYTLAPSEAGSGLEDGWISARSPLGSSLIGRAPGDVVDVEAPGRACRYRILQFEEG